MNSVKDFPLVSIIIPCRNEEKFIKTVLNNIIDQDYRRDSIEVFVVDGLSDDNTRSIIKEMINQFPLIHFISNENKTVPYALNLAIQKAKGEVIIRMDAHCIYPNNYVSALVEKLFELNADNVGGVWITEPGNNSSQAIAIAKATSNRLGIGNAGYRLGAAKPVQTDTVPFGCYRKDVFEKIGLFDIQLTRNQDDEFNGRLIKNGGKIFLIPSVKIKYFARKNISSMSKMFYQYGYFKPLVNIKLGFVATARQLIPPAFVLMIFLGALLSLFSKILMTIYLLGVFFYFVVVAIVSLKLFEKKLSVFLNLLIVFPAIHFSYGTGYLSGIIDFIFLRKHKRKKSIEVEMNR